MDARIITGLGLAAAAVALAACTGGKLQPQGAAAPDRQLLAQAAGFEGFMRRAGAIDAGFKGPAEVNAAVLAGARYEPQAMEAGMIAYASLAALQEPKFVAAVRSAGRTPAAQRELTRRLTADPAVAFDIPGGSAAAGRAAAALERHGSDLGVGGRQVKKSAYTLQAQAWSKVMVSDAKGRLTRVKQAGAQPFAGPVDPARLQAEAGAAGRRSGAGGPVVARALALAALSALGEEDKGRALMAEPKSGMCLRLAKINYHQCLASAGPYYEDIYCLGQHAMIDTSQCVVEAARAPAAQRRAEGRGGLVSASWRR